jgi:hypothetical protein
LWGQNDERHQEEKSGENVIVKIPKKFDKLEKALD